LNETMQRAGTRPLDAARATLGLLLSGLNWVGLALLLVARALLVYLSAVLESERNVPRLLVRLTLHRQPNHEGGQDG
jgi:hypothetical protein